MVNPLLLLPVLSASILNTTGNGCYKQNRPGQPQRVSTTYTVCTQAINRIAFHRTLDEPVAFGRSVKVGHSLPDQFVQRGFYGSCVINIDMEDGQQDVLTWRDILIGASDLRDECVAPPPHLGGEAKAGPRKLLEIKMYGLENKAEEGSERTSSGSTV